MSLGLADARRTLPAPMHSANCKIWLQRYVLGLFFMVRARAVLVKGHLNAIAYNDILDYSVFPILWQQFGEGPLLFQHYSAPMHKARSLQKWFVKICVDELDWPTET
jgi:hypothetical protein